MIVTIQNECLTVDIEDLGAQLASVRNHHGTEYLWQGDADIWARRAPILFPVLCGLKDNTYLLDDSNIMAFIRKLRKKIEPDPDAPKYILTIWGIGYKFNDQL